MEHAVSVAGPEGITRTDLHAVFDTLGKERRERGMAWMRQAGNVAESSEMRPNKAGRSQIQIVFRALPD